MQSGASRRQVWLRLWLMVMPAVLGLAAGCRERPASLGRELRLAYVGWDASGQMQLFVYSAESLTTTQLTHETARILDYAPAPDGSVIVYSRQRPDGGSDLWQLHLPQGEAELFVACPDALCHNGVWSPDSQRLVYEPPPLAPTATSPGPSVLWWAAAATGQTVPLFDNPADQSLGARFSPDGRWISFVAPDRQEIQLYELATGRLLLMPSQTGEPGAWSPDSQRFLFTQFHTQGEALTGHIIRAGLTDQTVVDLSGEAWVDDGAPSWSPDGQWIAFGRKIPRAAVGQQLYLISPDGRQTRQLTDEPTLYHGPPVWSADSQYLAFQQYNLTTQADPAICLLHCPPPALRQVAAAGIWPAWLP